MSSRMRALGAIVQGLAIGVLLIVALAVMLAQGAASAVFRYQGF